MNAHPAPLLALPNYSSFGKTATPDKDADELKYAFRAAGYKVVGSGAAVTAFLSPAGDRVVKVASPNMYARGSRETIDAALANPDNPHLPRVYGVMDLEGGAFVAETEVLDPLYEHDAGPRYREWSKEWNPRHFDLPDDLNGLPDGPMKDATAALMTVFGTRGSDRWDTHYGNVMVRPSDGALVLNDLIA